MKKISEFVKSNKRKAMQVVAQTVALAGGIFMSAKEYAAASGIGENAMKAATNEFQWIAWAILAFILVKLLAAKNFVAAGISGIAGAIIVVIISDPTKLTNVGNFFVNAIFK